MTSQTPARAGADVGARILDKLGRVGSRRLVFDSGLVSLDDPRIIALHEGYDDLTKVFEHPSRTA